MDEVVGANVLIGLLLIEIFGAICSATTIQTLEDIFIFF